MLFELIYKTMIVMIDINNVLRELNILSSKKSKSNIDKLMNLISTDQTSSKSFSSKITFAFFVLFAVSVSIISDKTIEFFTKVFKIIHFNNARAIIVDDVQRIVNIILYKQLIILLVITSIDAR